MNTHSPPLPNLHSLSISPPPHSQQQAAYSAYPTRYSGVFGPLNGIGGIGIGTVLPPGSPDWSSGGKRSSRSGLPSNWYDPPEYRDPSPPSTLSPPSSVPTTASSNHHSHPSYTLQPQPSYPNGSYPIPMGLVGTPSPPPMSFVPMASFPQHPYGVGNRNAQQAPQQQQQLHNQANGWRSGYALPPPTSDIIPTAIVIKNIPFSISRDTLLSIISSLSAPLPYAFNYHHDNGVFRGLAFANFREEDEARRVVAALNGYDVQGRKLRVEYKKVLQPGEKDKIEREKALKRMRSLQFDRKDMVSLSLPQRNPISLVQGGYDSPPHSASSTSQSHSSNPSQSHNQTQSQLDMNDPSTLDIYSRILVFKEDRMRDELAFSKNLTESERRIVHLVAQRLGLSTTARDDSVVVTRIPQPAPSAPVPQLLHSTSAYLSAYPTAPAPTDSPNLRYKKSMPDLRGFNGPVVSRDPTRSLTPQRSSGNLRSGADGISNIASGVLGREYSSMGAASTRKLNGSSSSFDQGFNGIFGRGHDIPPVPPLPSAFNTSSHNKGAYSVSSLNGIATNGVNGSGRISPEDLLSPVSVTSFSGQQSQNLSSPQPFQPQLQGLGQAAQAVRNPRGPAGESRGFTSNPAANVGLRSMPSRSMMAPPPLPSSASSSIHPPTSSASSLSNSGAGTIGLGPGSTASSLREGSVGNGLGGKGDKEGETMRTRESLEI
ncbi:uncharacterized protein L203_104423 [Cryptococcus depauperatus CBS 7841]|uniref:Uncharacterized protein n=1 Tax=Cryptococcus depauperatus CBS 7841 TaxID=1295531 RepID=A0A1E3IG61_9TREE|nr:hypothetical protein L203_03361 [Cryptococcus depauperatus CBS 7841]